MIKQTDEERQQEKKSMMPYNILLLWSIPMMVPLKPLLMSTQKPMS